MRGLVVVVGVFFVCAAVSRAQDDYYSRTNLLAFADHLFATGDYERSIGEYLRAAARSETVQQRDSLWYRIAVAHLFSANPSETRRYCARLSQSDTLRTDAASCLRAFSYFVEKRYDSIDHCARPSRDPRMVERFNVIETASHLKRYRWEDAAPHAAAGGGDTLARTLEDIAQQGASLRLKSPVAAGLLSAIVPGSGKWYARRAWDGVLSLLIIGSSAWQAYEGYRKDGLFSSRCLLFGGLGSVFYAGNVYGSVVAAKRYNTSKQAAVAARVHLEFDW